MDDVTPVLEKHTAGVQAIGFDYQFYYFMLLALQLKLGQRIGFEVKDDVHIDKEDGSTVLLQTKHSTIVNAEGQAKNLTTLDVDLWKTLSNWTDFIKGDKESNTFLNKHSFILVTNKNSSTNDFLNTLATFNKDSNIDPVQEKLKELKSQTENETIKSYIKNILSLGKRKMKLLLEKTSFEVGVDEIILKIKDKIRENVREEKFVDPIFESLSSNLLASKYTDIKDRKKFEFTCDEFNKRFGKCFRVAFESKSLPKRNLPVLLPENLEDQIFVKQLIDIGEAVSGSPYIRDYTTQMLKFLNEFSYWTDEHLLLPTDIEAFKTNSIRLWLNEFRAKYRAIEKKLHAGTRIEDIEDEIKNLGIDLVDYVRKQDLAIPGFVPLGIESSNGHFYALSDNLEIGWHFDWKNKYIK